MASSLSTPTVLSPPLQFPSGGVGAQFSKFQMLCSGWVLHEIGTTDQRKGKKKDVEKIFSGGFSKTRDNLSVIDELLLCWNLSDTDPVLDEIEEVYFQALLVSDFGPKITIKIVERLRDDIYAGKLKSGTEIKEARL